MNDQQPALAITFLIATLTAAVAALGAVITGGGEDFWYGSLIKPAFNPPGLAFAVVWPILFALMAFGAVLVRIKAGSFAAARAGLSLYFMQLAVNLSWSWLFFGFHQIALALIALGLLWVLVAMMIRGFSKFSTAAAILQVPYFLWVSFAGYLNGAILLLNQ